MEKNKTEKTAVEVKTNPNAPHTVHIRTEKQKGGGKKVGLFVNQAEAEKAQKAIIEAKTYDGEALTDKQTVVVAEYEKESPITFTEWQEEANKDAEREAALSEISPELLEKLRKTGAFRRGI